MWLQVMLLAWLPWLLLGGAGLYLGVRAVRAFERRGSAHAELAAIRERLLALEETVTAQAQELHHLAEGQQFAERLLTERAPIDRHAASADPAH